MSLLEHEKRGVNNRSSSVTHQKTVNSKLSANDLVDSMFENDFETVKSKRKRMYKALQKTLYPPFKIVHISSVTDR